MAIRPNVLFIMTDQQRHDTLSIVGSNVVQTPNLDRLAREGVLFRQATTPWPVCGPARACLFTGQYAHTHGAFENVCG
jgi:arylsulfatase